MRREYFPDRADLDNFVVSWSRRRQKRTLGSCNLNARRINVAQELMPAEYSKWLAPLLYHELCHAYLGHNVGYQGSKKCWHGSHFKELEARHPESLALQNWMRSGGWAQAVRKNRAQKAAKARWRK